MPKHTKRRETFAESPPFDSPQDEDFAQAKAARRTELFAAIPEQGDVNAPTPPPKDRSTGVLEKAVDSFFESPTKRGDYRPAPAKGNKWSNVALGIPPVRPAGKTTPAGKKPPARFV